MRIEVDAQDLVRSRFAISPLVELVHVLRHLTGRVRHPMPAAWLSRQRQSFEPLRDTVGVRALVALHPPRYGANFVSPPPAGVAQTLDDDLAAVRATPVDLAREEIRRCLDRAGPPDADVLALLESPDVVSRVADTVEVAWEVLVAPYWPQVRAILERDVVHRAGQLTRSGWAGALADMHPQVVWSEGGIELSGIDWPEPSVRLDGRGLLFVPSAFLYPGLAVYAERPWHPALAYPARGIAALWETTPVHGGDALGRLVGRSRAAILTALDEPASPTQLVHTLGLSLGAVGDHLGALRGAGLVSRARAGHSVLYRRSPVGDALVAAAEG